MCPDRLAHLGVCALLPEHFPWPPWWPGSWGAWGIIVPAYEKDGSLASIHGRATLADSSPKTRWPMGYQSKGLIFADGPALSILRGSPPEGVKGVLLCEGITDFLAACLSVDREGLPLAVIGGVSGSWGAVGRIPWPPSLRLYLAMDRDRAGDAYCDAVTRALGSRLGWRVPIPPGRDIADIYREGGEIGGWIERAEIWSPRIHQGK